MTTSGDDELGRFRAAVAALDAGDLPALTALLDAHPELLNYRCHEGEWYERGYFAGATLLQHVAGNPIRAPLPANIVEITRLLLERGARDEPARPRYTVGLILTGKQPSEARVSLQLIDLITAASGLPLDLEDPRLLDAPLRNHAPWTAEELIRRGARVELRHGAALGRADEVERFFTGTDGTLPADPAERQAQIDRAYLAACMRGHTAIALSLLDRGADPAAMADVGQTGLHCAVYLGNRPLVQALLARGMPLDVKNSYGGTVLDQAQWSAEHEPHPDLPGIIEDLIAAGARV